MKETSAVPESALRISRCCWLVMAVLAAIVALSCNPPDYGKPTVVITEPAPNALVPAIVRVRALAVSPNEIARVSLFADSQEVAISDSSQDTTISFIWNATAESAWTRHRLQVEVMDIREHVARSAEIEVTVAGTSGPIHHAGAITRDETWYALASPHIVSGVLDVQAHLTIEPGAIIKFDSFALLRVGRGHPGGLTADGANSLITFTSNEPNAKPGDWLGIEFAANAEPGWSVLNNCLIEYGGYDDSAECYHHPVADSLQAELGGSLAAVMVHGGPVRITDCIVRYGGNYGVTLRDPGIDGFSGNALTGNRANGLAVLPMLVGAVGSGNSFSANGVNGIAILHGPVTADVTWPNLNVPYTIDSALVVRAPGQYDQARLTIAPGITLLFDQRGLIDVESGAELIADGSGGVITFTALGSESWGGISINGDWEPGNGTYYVSTLKNCVVEYACNEGAIMAFGGVLNIRNSIIRNCGYYGLSLDEMSWFEDFRDNIVTGCEGRALAMDAEYARTIGPGNRLTGNDVDDYYEDGVELSGDNEVMSSGTWPDCGVPYLIYNDIFFENYFDLPPVITIAPGTRLMLNESGIYVEQGALLAEGTSNRIVFTRDPIEDPDSGAWSSITFSDSSSVNRSVLRGCLIECGGDADDGNIVCDGTAPVIENNEISHSAQYGVWLAGSSLDPDTLRAHNLFHDNALGDVGVGPARRPASHPTLRTLMRRPRPVPLPGRRAAVNRPVRSGNLGLMRHTRTRVGD